MLILDAHNRLLPDMQTHKLDLEDFFPSLKVCGPEELLKSPLEGRSDVLLLDVPSLAGVPVDDTLLSHLNTFPAILAFMPAPAQAEWEKWLAGIMTLSDKVIAVHRLPMGEDGWNLVRNQLLLFWRQKEEKRRFREQMVRFSQDMDELIKAAHKDMQRAKKIHEDVVPKRSEELRGLTLYSKYAVGEGAGSEFSDLIKGTTDAHIFFLHTNSYLASSCLMGIINKYKGGGSFDTHLFLQEAAMEIRSINLHKKKPVHVELLLARINSLTLEVEGHCFGGFEMLVLGKPALPLPRLPEFDLERTEAAHFRFVLERGEKAVVFSPGFIFNWDEGGPTMDRGHFWERNARLPASELLMEYFFQLKKDVTGEFLPKDATVVMLEVHRHVIQKV